MTNATQVEVLASVRDRLTELYGDRLERVLLFGSRARGDQQAGSDIDLLVVLAGPVTPGLEIARTGPATAALSLENDVVVSCTFISEDRWAHERSPLLLNVRREGVAL